MRSKGWRDRREVVTQSGAVRGRAADGVAAFKGIPYAAALFGSDRLQAPRSHDPSTGVFDAFDYGRTSPRAPYPPPFDFLLAEQDIPGRKCLGHGNAQAIPVPDSRNWWAAMWADRVRLSSYADQAIAYGLADRSELDAIADAWRRWATQPDGIFVTLAVEVIARRPG